MKERVAINLTSAAKFLAAQAFLERIEFAKSCGLAAVEFHPSREWPADKTRLFMLQEPELKRVRDCCQQIAGLSVHGPMGKTVAVPQASVRRQVTRDSKLAIREAAFLGATAVVVHCHMGEIDQPEVAGRVAPVLAGWAKYGQEFGVKVCLETPTDLRDPSHFTALIQQIDHPNLGATIDTGHLLKCLDEETKHSPRVAQAYNDMLLDLTRAVMSLGKLFHMHLNDIGADTLADHYGMGLGFVDFERVLKAVMDDGYEGLLVLEIHRGAGGEAGGITEDEFRQAVRHVLDIVG